MPSHHTSHQRSQLSLSLLLCTATTVVNSCACIIYTWYTGTRMYSAETFSHLGIYHTYVRKRCRVQIEITRNYGMSGAAKFVYPPRVPPINLPAPSHPCGIPVVLTVLPITRSTKPMSADKRYFQGNPYLHDRRANKTCTTQKRLQNHTPRNPSLKLLCVLFSYSLLCALLGGR